MELCKKSYSWNLAHNFQELAVNSECNGVKIPASIELQQSQPDFYYGSDFYSTPTLAVFAFIAIVCGMRPVTSYTPQSYLTWIQFNLLAMPDCFSEGTDFSSSRHMIHF